jgi:hypothetical protein
MWLDDTTGVIPVRMPLDHALFGARMPAVGDAIDVLGKLMDSLSDPTCTQRWISCHSMSLQTDAMAEMQRQLEIICLYQENYFKTTNGRLSAAVRADAVAAQHKQERAAQAAAQRQQNRARDKHRFATSRNSARIAKLEQCSSSYFRRDGLSALDQNTTAHSLRLKNKSAKAVSPFKKPTVTSTAPPATATATAAAAAQHSTAVSSRSNHETKKSVSAPAASVNEVSLYISNNPGISRVKLLQVFSSKLQPVQMQKYLDDLTMNFVIYERNGLYHPL